MGASGTLESLKPVERSVPLSATDSWKGQITSRISDTWLRFPGAALASPPFRRLVFAMLQNYSLARP